MKAEHLAEKAFREYRGHVYRFLLRRTGDPHQAEELTQRVFADAVAALRDRRTCPGSTLAWLYAVAERRFVDEVRRRAVAHAGLRLLSQRDEAPDLIYSRSIARTLCGAISQLPEQQRSVFLLRVMEGRSFGEIAQRVGASEAACKMRLSRALVQIKISLNERGVGPGA